MNVTVRKYRSDDYASCVALSRQLAEHHADIYEVSTDIIKPQDRWLDELMSKEGFTGFWVAEIESNIVGFCGLFVYGEEGEIEPVVVANSVRNHGIGTKLVKCVTKEATKKKVRYLSIRPVARNKRAIDLFIRLGFDTIGHLDLFQDLSSHDDRTWKSGLAIHGNKLKY
jgi:N-acetylglutamate synthase-like GNAT family acetyltransferase